jgi:DNA-binding Xre family transcriptional regulator
MIEVSYDKLFAYLYKNSISKSELAKKTGVSRNTIIKMSKGEIVHLNVIVAICETYGLELCEVVELKKAKKGTT